MGNSDKKKPWDYDVTIFFTQNVNICSMLQACVNLHVIRNSFSFTTSDSHSRELFEIVNSIVKCNTNAGGGGHDHTILSMDFINRSSGSTSFSRFPSKLRRANNIQQYSTGGISMYVRSVHMR